MTDVVNFGEKLKVVVNNKNMAKKNTDKKRSAIANRNLRFLNDCDDLSRKLLTIADDLNKRLSPDKLQYIIWYLDELTQYEPQVAIFQALLAYSEILKKQAIEKQKQIQTKSTPGV
jgi:hypothetical protein